MKMPQRARICFAAAFLALPAQALAGKRPPAIVKIVEMNGKSYEVRQRGEWAHSSQRSIVVRGDRKYWKALERAAEIATGCGSKGLTPRGPYLEVWLDCSITPPPPPPDVVVRLKPKN